jgi:hypothetical protein
MKYTQEQVEKIFIQQGCVLKDQYLGYQIPMTYICSCGNLSDIRLANFLQGNRCKACGIRKASKTNTQAHANIAQYFKAQGCELLDQYTHSMQPMKYRCSCGMVAMINWNDFKTGHRCSICGSCKQRNALSEAKGSNWNPNRAQVKENADAQQVAKQLLTNTLKRVGTSKEGHTNELLGYSAKELMSHLQDHPNWENLKSTKWHIDHIFPIKAFRTHGITDVSVINAFDNLQPLSANENLAKRDQYDEDKFLRYCERHGLQVA